MPLAENMFTYHPTFRPVLTVLIFWLFAGFANAEVPSDWVRFRGSKSLSVAAPPTFSCEAGFGEDSFNVRLIGTTLTVTFDTMGIEPRSVLPVNLEVHDIIVDGVPAKLQIKRAGPGGKGSVVLYVHGKRPIGAAEFIVPAEDYNLAIKIFETVSFKAPEPSEAARPCAPIEEAIVSPAQHLPKASDKEPSDSKVTIKGRTFILNRAGQLEPEDQ